MVLFAILGTWCFAWVMAYAALDFPSLVRLPMLLCGYGGCQEPRTYLYVIWLLLAVVAALPTMPANRTMRRLDDQHVQSDVAGRESTPMSRAMRGQLFKFLILYVTGWISVPLAMMQLM